jgi:kynurenine 3-monooxygenase
VAIIGGGLAGCLLACYLGRRGLAVRVYERRPDPRSGQAERGRSINLAISERGLDALRRIGLADASSANHSSERTVMADALPMRGRMIHPVHGPLDFQPYSAGGDLAINSISRAALNHALLDAAEAGAGVEIVFDHQLVELDAAERGAGRAEAVAMVFDTPSGRVRAAAGVVLGADGAGSAVRGQLLGAGLLDERLDFLDYGYKELHIPPLTSSRSQRSGDRGDFALDPGALHIWPRGSSMMIALPNPDHSFTCTLFWPNGGTGCFAALSSPAAIERHFRTHYPDFVPLAPTLVEDYQHNPVGLLGTVHATPWHAAGRIGLVGDAAHAIVPFYGQGANCAFEDVVELDRCLDDTGGEWSAALPLFERRRRDNTEAIAAMALDNFVEMRDRVASPVFRLAKRVEHGLEKVLPGVYRSRYELVSFTTTPYAEVRRRVRLQHAALAGTAAAGIAVATAAITIANLSGRSRQ